MSDRPHVPTQRRPQGCVSVRASARWPRSGAHSLMFAQSCRVNFAAPTRAHPKPLSRCVARRGVDARERFVVVDRPVFAILGTHGTPPSRAHPLPPRRCSNPVRNPVRSKSTRSVVTMASDAPTPKNIGFIGAGIMGAQTPSLATETLDPETPLHTIRPASSSSSSSSSSSPRTRLTRLARLFRLTRRTPFAPLLLLVPLSTQASPWRST